MRKAQHIMKPVQGNEQYAPCKNCVLKAGKSCLYKTEIERPSLKRFIDEGSRIDKLYLGKYLPLREKKLLTKLLKTKAEYDDVRMELLSLSGTSVDVNEKVDIRPKEVTHRDETERSSAVSGFFDSVDKGEMAGVRRLSQCCSCCSCGSMLDEYGMRGLHNFRRVGHAHRRDSYSSSKLRIGDKMRLRRRKRFKAKNIASAPCTCEAKISCIKEELKHEMAFHSEISKAIFTPQENKRETVRTKRLKEMKSFRNKELNKQTKNRKDAQTSTDGENNVQITNQTKKRRTFRVKESPESRNKTSKNKKIAESLYSSTDAKQEREIESKRGDELRRSDEQGLIKLKKKRTKLLGLMTNKKYLELAAKNKVEPRDKKISKLGLKDSKSTVESETYMEEQETPSNVTNITKQLASNAHRYSKTRLRRSFDKGSLKLKRKRSRMKTNVQASARKSVESAKNIKNKINEKMLRLKKPTQVTKLPETDATGKAELRKGDKDNMHNQDIRRKSGIDEDSECRCIEEKFHKIERSAKHKDSKDKSTKIISQTKRKDIKVGEITTEPIYGNVRKVSTSSLIIKTSAIGKEVKRNDRKVGKLIAPPRKDRVAKQIKKFNKKSSTSNVGNLARIGKEVKKNIKISDPPSSSSVNKITTTDKETKRKDRKVGNAKTPSSIVKSPGIENKPQQRNKNVAEVTNAETDERKISISIGNKERIRKTKVINQKLKHVNRSVKSMTSVQSSTKNSIRAASSRAVSKVKKSHQKRKLQARSTRPKSVQSYTARDILKNTTGSRSQTTIADQVKPPTKQDKGKVKKGHRLYHTLSQRTTSAEKFQNTTKHSLRRCMCTLKLGRYAKVKVKKVKPKSVSKGSMTSHQNIGDNLADQGLSHKSISTGSTEYSGELKTKLLPYECEPGICVPDKCDPYICLKLINNRQGTKNSGERRRKLLPYECEPDVCVPDKCDPNNCVKLVNSRQATVIKHYGKQSNTENPTTKSSTSITSTPSKSKRVQSTAATHGTEMPARKYNENFLVKNVSQKVLPSPNKQLIKISSSFSFHIEFSREGSPITKQRPEKYLVKHIPRPKTSTKQGHRSELSKHSDLNTQRRTKQRSSQRNINRNEKSSVTQVEVKQKNALIGAAKRCFCTLKFQKGGKRKNKIIENISKRISVLSIQKSVVSTQTVSDRSRRRNETKSAKIQKTRNNAILAYQLCQSIDKNRHPHRAVRIISNYSFEEFYKYRTAIGKKLSAETTIKQRRALRSTEYKNKTKEIVMRNREYKTNTVSKGIKKILKGCICKLQLRKQSVKQRPKSKRQLESYTVSGIALTKTKITAKRHSLSFEYKPITHEMEYLKCQNKTELVKHLGLGPNFKINSSSSIMSFHKHSNFKSSFYAMNVRVPVKPKRHKLEPYECEPGICIPGKCNPYECLKRINRRLMRKTSTMTTATSKSTSSFTAPDPKRARQIQSKTHAHEKHTKTKNKPTKNKPIKTKPRRSHTSTVNSKPTKITHRRSRTDYIESTKRRPRRSNTDIVYESVPETSQRQVVRVGSTFSFNIEFFKNKKPKTEHIIKSVSPSRASKSVKSTISMTPRHKGAKSRRAHRHNKNSQSVASVADSGSSVSPRLKRCFCTLKFQKQGKRPAKHKEMKLVAHAGTRARKNDNERKVAAHSTRTEAVKPEATLNNRGVMARGKLKPYECEPGICLPGQCDPYQCQKWINQRLKREFGTTARQGYKSVASTVGTRSKGRTVQHGRKRHKSMSSITSTTSRPGKMQHGGARHRNASSISVSRRSRGRRIQHTGSTLSKSRKLQHTGRPPRQTPSYIVSDTPSRQAVKIGSCFSFNVEFYKDRGGEAVKVMQYPNVRRERLPPLPRRERPPPKPRSTVTNTRSRTKLNTKVGGHPKRSQSSQSQFETSKKAGSTMTGRQFLKRCFCTLALKHKKQPIAKRSSEASTLTGRRRVEPTLTEASTVTKKIRKRDMKPTLSEISTETKGKYAPVPVAKDANTKTRRLEPYECEPYVCIPGKCNPRECLKRIQRKNMRDLATTTNPHTRSIGSTGTNASKAIKIQYMGRGARDAHSKTPRTYVKDAHSRDPKRHIRDAQSTTPTRYVRDAHATSSRRRVKDVQSTATVEAPNQTVTRTLPGPSPQPEKQAVRIGSCISFDIEFFKDRSQRAEQILSYHKEKKKREISKGQRKRHHIKRPSKQSLATSQQSVSTRHKKLQRHRHHRTSPSQVGSTTSMHSTITESPLKRCFCTLGLLDKNTKTHNVYLALQPKGYTPNSRPYKNNLRKLDPNECEPGICIPGECDPFECAKQIQRRKMDTKMTVTDQYNRRSTSSVTSGSNRAMQTQSRLPHYKNQKVHGEKYFVEKPRFRSINSTFRQAVRIGSSFSFNIEFHKDKLGPNVPDVLKIRQIEDTHAEVKDIKPFTKTLKNRGVHGQRPSYSDGYSQARGVSVENRGVGPLLKRCFCTLGLLQKNNKTTKTPEKKRTHETATAGVGTKKKINKLKPRECEPGICIPGECDPYECLERMKRRHTRDFGTGPGQVYSRPASTYTSNGLRTRGISQSSRNNYKNKTTTCPREKIKVTKPIPQYVPQKSLPISVHPHRQAVRIGSGFSFDIEFFKDRKTPYVGDQNIEIKTYEPKYHVQEIKQKRPYVNRGYGENVQSRNHSSQMTCPRRVSTGSGMGPMLKRCFCTLKLQKTPYGRTEIVNYMYMPPPIHIKTKNKNVTVGSIVEKTTLIGFDAINCSDKNMYYPKVTTLEYKSKNPVNNIICSTPAKCLKTEKNSRGIINIIKNFFHFSKLRNTAPKPKKPPDNSVRSRKATVEKGITNRKDCRSRGHDNVQKSCICNNKQLRGSVKRNAGSNEMKTIFPYIPTKFNNNVSKTLIIQNNNKLKSALRSSTKYCSHCNERKSVIDSKDNKKMQFNEVAKSIKNKNLSHDCTKIDCRETQSKKINFKNIKRHLTQLFKKDLPIIMDVGTKVDVKNVKNSNRQKDLTLPNVEILKTSKSDRHPTSSKYNFIPKKSNSLKVTKVSEKNRRSKNYLKYVEQENKVYSRFQSGDAKQNLLKTNIDDGVKPSTALFKYQKSMSAKSPYMNDKVVQFALISPKRRDFRKKLCNRRNDLCAQDLCVSENVNCPCSNDNKNKSTRKGGRQEMTWEIQNFQKQKEMHKSTPAIAADIKNPEVKKKTSAKANSNVEKQVESKGKTSPKDKIETQAKVCKTRKPCACCYGKKQIKSDGKNKKLLNVTCVTDCKTKTPGSICDELIKTVQKCTQKRKKTKFNQSPPLFEMKLAANSMDILNKDHVYDTVRRLKPKGKANLHEKDCQCCICKNARRGKKRDDDDFTVELPKLSRRQKLQLKTKPCVCGSVECARESSKNAQLKALSLMPKKKPCVCGTKICTDESLKMDLKDKKISKKAASMRMKQMSSKKREQTERLRKRKDEQNLLSRQKRYKMEDAERRRRQILADKYMQKQVKKYSDSSDTLLIVESVLDVAKLGVKTVTGLMRCFCRAIFDPKNTYRRMKTAAQDRDRICVNIKDAVSDFGVGATGRRVGMRLRATRYVSLLIRKFEQQPVLNYLVHLFDTNPKNRLKHKKRKSRRREPIEFECSLFMASIRKRPHIWLYYACPWFYPHCIGMLGILRQFGDAMLFILAVLVWSPCIMAMEICRACMCCTLCTG